MADPRDVETVAAAIHDLDWSEGPPPVRDMAEAALNAMTELPRRAKEVRVTRNG